ncbi:hypothetical protein V8C40DRAFT_236992 [Trichoderma camerunense]
MPSIIICVLYHKGAQVAIPIPCSDNELALASQRTNSPAGTENPLWKRGGSAARAVPAMNNQAALYLVAPPADAVEVLSSHWASRVPLPLTSRVIFFSGMGTVAVASAGLFPATRLLVSAGVVDTWHGYSVGG